MDPVLRFSRKTAEQDDEDANPAEAEKSLAAEPQGQPERSGPEAVGGEVAGGMAMLGEAVQSTSPEAEQLVVAESAVVEQSAGAGMPPGGDPNPFWSETVQDEFRLRAMRPAALDLVSARGPPQSLGPVATSSLGPDRGRPQGRAVQQEGASKGPASEASAGSREADQQIFRDLAGMLQEVLVRQESFGVRLAKLEVEQARKNQRP